MSLLIEHPHFLEAVRATVDLIEKTRPGCIGRLCGPTGYGKSEIAIRAAQLVFGDAKHWGIGTVPIAFVRAVRNIGGRFGGKYFAKRAWVAVQDPDLRWLEKNTAGYADAREHTLKQFEQTDLYRAMGFGLDEGGLRDAFRDMAIARGLKVLVIEDAHTMTSSSRHIRPADFVQPWVSLAEEIGLILIFVGTPALMNLWDPEDEAHRRSRTKFVKRYLIDTKAEKKQFALLLAQIAKDYVWQANYGPIRDGELIYLMTMGVFGQIRTYFDRAQLRSRERNGESIGPEDLRAAAMSAEELKQMVQNIVGFEVAARPTSFDEARAIHREVKNERKVG